MVWGWDSSILGSLDMGLTGLEVGARLRAIGDATALGRNVQPDPVDLPPTKSPASGLLPSEAINSLRVNATGTRSLSPRWSAF